MPIIGVTHSKDGQTIIRRSVMTKVAIGRGPDQKSNYPQKLDHFIFLRKQAGDDKTVEWVDDEAKIKHYQKLAGGEDPTEITIILLDDEIDHIFRTEFAWWKQSGKACSGDGEKAVRDDQPYGPCANSGKCEQYENGDCKPSADLYFMLADFPSLGTVCRLHTSSYQSIRELYSALVDLRSMMGGRLFGLPVKLFVRPEKNVYQDSKGNKKTGTKYILGLELRAESLPGMLESVTQSAQVFADLKKIMGGRRLELIEDDRERAPEIAAEFHQIEPANGPAAAQLPATVGGQAEIQAFHDLAEKKGLNRAARHMLLGKHEGNLERATNELTTLPAVESEQLVPTVAGKPKGGRKAKTSPAPAIGPAAPQAPTAAEVKYGF
jgi:Recombination directionality factor-like